MGSCKLDPRSAHLNTEVAVVVEDVGAAAEALRPMERRLEGSVRLGQSGAPEAGSVRAPKAPLKRRLLLVVARLVAPFVHRQL